MQGWFSWSGLQCRLLIVILTAAYQITRGGRSTLLLLMMTDHNRVCFVRRTRESALCWTPHGRGLEYRHIIASLSSAMCQHCKLVTAHGRRQASPPFHALFPFLVQMLKRWIRTIRAPPSQIANRARPFPSAWKPFPTVPREWTESKVHSPRDFRGSRGIAAKMSFSTVQLEYAVDDTT